MVTPRVAMVTGGARGIGAAIAEMLHARGHAVAVADLSLPDGMVQRGDRRFAGTCDVSNASSVRQFVDAARDVLGPIDILVNNAGIYPMQPFLEMTQADWHHVFTVNVDSVFHCSQAVLPDMRSRGWGRIINITSNTFFMGLPGMAHYIGSKGAVIGITRSLASEFGADGITVNCVAPNFTRTPGTAPVEEHAPDVVAQAVAAQAVPRVQLPGDLTGAVGFLASDDSAFVTGQTLVVDGGAIKH